VRLSLNDDILHHFLLPLPVLFIKVKNVMHLIVKPSDLLGSMFAFVFYGDFLKGHPMTLLTPVFFLNFVSGFGPKFTDKFATFGRHPVIFSAESYNISPFTMGSLDSLVSQHCLSFKAQS
jgi:hypothetical protein